MNRFITAALALVMLGTAPSMAVTPDEVLADTGLESRAREISQLLRCVVCQNQSIDDSNAPLAKDLRVLVRERLTAGDSNTQTLNYIVARYGNFVLLKPPMQTNTLLLWFGPALLFALAAFGLIKTLKRQQTLIAPTGTAPLSKTDEARLAKLLQDDAAP
jgi:cytochrome c-type biogenesis protein CcmH